QTRTPPDRKVGCKTGQSWVLSLYRWMPNPEPVMWRNPGLLHSVVQRASFVGGLSLLFRIDLPPLDTIPHTSSCYLLHLVVGIDQLFLKIALPFHKYTTLHHWPPFLILVSIYH